MRKNALWICYEIFSMGVLESSKCPYIFWGRSYIKVQTRVPDDGLSVRASVLSGPWLVWGRGRTASDVRDMTFISVPRAFCLPLTGLDRYEKSRWYFLYSCTPQHVSLSIKEAGNSSNKEIFTYQVLFINADIPKRKCIRGLYASSHQFLYPFFYTWSL